MDAELESLFAEGARRLLLNRAARFQARLYMRWARLSSALCSARGCIGGAAASILRFTHPGNNVSMTSRLTSIRSVPTHAERGFEVDAEFLVTACTALPCTDLSFPPLQSALNSRHPVAGGAVRVDQGSDDPFGP